VTTPQTHLKLNTPASRASLKKLLRHCALAPKFMQGLGLAVATLIMQLFLITPALAAVTLTVLEDEVVAYSGPGEKYRPLAVLSANTELRASSKVFESAQGRFYKVIVPTGEKQRAVGFVSVSASVRLSGAEDNVDLEKFGVVALVDSAVQFSYASLKDRQSLWTVGYMNYLSPGFYVKAFAGQWLAPSAQGTLGGGEIGNDALLFGAVSGFVQYQVGALSTGAKDSFFAGSTPLNVFMGAGAGLRYNLGGVASIAIGINQVAIYNANNSLVSNGLLMSLEAGL